VGYTKDGKPLVFVSHPPSGRNARSPSPPMHAKGGSPGGYYEAEYDPPPPYVEVVPPRRSPTPGRHAYELYECPNPMCRRTVRSYFYMCNSCGVKLDAYTPRPGSGSGGYAPPQTPRQRIHSRPHSPEIKGGKGLNFRGDNSDETKYGISNRINEDGIINIEAVNVAAGIISASAPTQDEKGRLYGLLYERALGVEGVKQFPFNSTNLDILVHGPFRTDLVDAALPTFLRLLFIDESTPEMELLKHIARNARNQLPKWAVTLLDADECGMNLFLNFKLPQWFSAIAQGLKDVAMATSDEYGGGASADIDDDSELVYAKRAEPIKSVNARSPSPFNGETRKRNVFFSDEVEENADKNCFGVRKARSPFEQSGIDILGAINQQCKLPEYSGAVDDVQEMKSHLAILQCKLDLIQSIQAVVDENKNKIAEAVDAKSRELQRVEQLQQLQREAEAEAERKAKCSQTMTELANVVLQFQGAREQDVQIPEDAKKALASLCQFFSSSSAAGSNQPVANEAVVTDAVVGSEAPTPELVSSSGVSEESMNGSKRSHEDDHESVDGTGSSPSENSSVPVTGASPELAAKLKGAAQRVGNRRLRNKSKQARR